MRSWRPFLPLVMVVALGSPFTGRLGHVWRELRDRAHAATAHPLAFAVSCVVLVALTLFLRGVRSRRSWRSQTLARAPIAHCDPYALGVKRAFLADRVARDGERAPYVERDLDSRIAAHVERAGDGPLDRLVLIVGPQLAGKSRTAFETVVRLLPDATVIAPKRRRAAARSTPAAEILRTRRRLGRARRHVLWLDDLGAELAHEHADAEDVIAWLARHRRAWVVATVEASADVDLTGFSAKLGDPTRPPFPLAPELSDRELARARPFYGARSGRLLLRELVEGEPILNTFAEGGTVHPTGVAIVRAAVDCARCRPGRPMTQALLRALHASYLGEDAAATERFEDGLAWATADDDGVAPLRGGGANVPTYEVAGALVDRADREEEPIPDACWSAVVADSANDPEALLVVADAARDRDRPDLASEIARDVAARFDDARASELLIALADESTAGQPAAPRAAAPRAPLGASPFRLHPRAASPRAAWLYAKPVLRSVLRVAALGAGDVLAVTAALTAMLVLRTLLFGQPPHGLVWSMTHFGAIAAAGSLAAFATARLYTEDAQRACLPAIVSAAALVGAGCVVVGLANGLDRGGYAVIVASSLLAIPAVHGLRHLYDVVSRGWLVRHGLRSRTLVVGEPAQAYAVGALLAHSSTRPLDLLGFVGEGDGDAPGRLGAVRNLGEAIRLHAVERVVLADPDMSRERQVEIADLCHRRGVRVELMPCAADLQLGVGAAHPRRAPGPVPVPPLRLSTGAALVKAAFDLTLSFALLLVLAIPMLAIAVGILLRSPGRPIVNEQCPGRGEVPFRLKRFRTTAVLPPVGAPGDQPAGADDAPQPTALGRWLERYRLDELPQLLNVLVGEMSLVGPRPLPLGKFERLEAWHKKRYQFTPGLTGDWQLSRHRTDLDEMARTDLAYMAGWSFARDVAILLKTPLALVRMGHRERNAQAAAEAAAEASA